MLDSIKYLLAKFSAISRGLGKLECPRGGMNFRNRSVDLSFVASEQYHYSIWIKLLLCMGAQAQAPPSRDSGRNP